MGNFRSSSNRPITSAPTTTASKTHVRPRTTSTKNMSNLDQQHPIPSVQSAIAEARRRTSTAENKPSAAHKRPLRRATNNTTNNAPTHYAKVDPDDYWKNLRNWDFLSDLNEQQQQQ